MSWNEMGARRAGRMPAAIKRQVALVCRRGNDQAGRRHRWAGPVGIAEERSTRNHSPVVCFGSGVIQDLISAAIRPNPARKADSIILIFLIRRRASVTAHSVSLSREGRPVPYTSFFNCILLKGDRPLAKPAFQAASPTRDFCPGDTTPLSWAQ